MRPPPREEGRIIISRASCYRVQRQVRCMPNSVLFPFASFERWWCRILSLIIIIIIVRYQQVRHYSIDKKTEHYNVACSRGVEAYTLLNTQLPQDNRRWTCKREPPYSIRYSIRIRIVAADSIEIRFERKLSICRSLDYAAPAHHNLPTFSMPSSNSVDQ